MSFRATHNVAVKLNYIYNVSYENIAGGAACSPLTEMYVYCTDITQSVTSPDINMSHACDCFTTYSTFRWHTIQINRRYVASFYCK